MNADRTVTSPFHHKTKQHQTPLIWTDQHCASTIGLKLNMEQRALWDFVLSKAEGVNWFIGKICLYIKKKKKEKKNNAIKSVTQFHNPLIFFNCKHFLVKQWKVKKVSVL